MITSDNQTLNSSLIYPDNKDCLPEEWNRFIETCEACRQCGLSQSRKQAVVLRGALNAPLMLVGEGPGAEEDEQGLPFVGASGRLLSLLMTAHGLSAENYHICNIVKCRPPNNRVPSPEEAKACKRLLAAQFKLVKPKVIILLGGTAFKYFTGAQEGITKTRGQWIEKNGFLIMPTFHPAYILRNNTQRIHLWQDIGKVRSKMEEMNLLEPLISQPQMPTARG